MRKNLIYEVYSESELTITIIITLMEVYVPIAYYNKGMNKIIMDSNTPLVYYFSNIYPISISLDSNGEITTIYINESGSYNELLKLSSKIKLTNKVGKLTICIDKNDNNASVASITVCNTSDADKYEKDLLERSTLSDKLKKLCPTILRTIRWIANEEYFIELI